MGIRGLMSFLEKYPIPLLSSVDVHDQFILVDCRALLFMFVHEAIEEETSRNYIEFRQKLLKFFHNLQRCDIIPIMIYDGDFRLAKSMQQKNMRPPFVREEDKDAYLEMGHDPSSIETISCSLESNVTRKLFVMIMKQTAAELKVPWFSARPESFEDLAALSKLLKIPVLSNNTIFAAFDIDVSYLMLHSFLWDKPEESDGRMVIKANLFSIRKIVETFLVKEDHFSLLCILFDKKTFKMYEKFRNCNFRKAWRIPQHLRTTNNAGFRRPNTMESALVWFSTTQKSSKNIVDDVIITIPDRKIGEQVRKEILRKLERYKVPKIRRILLLEMIEKISDPEICKLLESGLEQAISDESEAYLDDAVLRRMYEGNFPIWVPRFLHCQASNQHFASHHYVHSNKPPTVGSEIPILREVPKTTFQLLICEGKGEVNVDVYDDITNDGYEKAGSIIIEQSQRHDIDVYKPLEDLNEADMEERKDFLLNVLFPDGESLNKYKAHRDNLCDDMKFTLAITNFWVLKEKPVPTLVNAMLAMFSLEQVQNQQQEDMMQIRLPDGINGEKSVKAKAGVGKASKYVEVTRSALLWEECFESVITLNQILNFPFPEPSLGKIYNFSTLYKLYESVSNGEDIPNVIRAKEFLELYQTMLQIVS